MTTFFMLCSLLCFLLLVNRAIAVSITASDALALNSIRSSLIDSNGKLGWNSTLDPCGWKGITCNLEGRVTHIVLSELLLSGSLPSEIGKLSKLQVLDLGKNYLQGQVPSSLGRLSDLIKLVLSFNNFVGSIAFVSNLKNLTYIDLSYNYFSGIMPNFCKSSNLSFLSVGFNELTGSISSLSCLIHLEYLDISSNLFDTKESLKLSNFPGLKHLDMSYLGVGNDYFPTFIKLKELRFLKCSSCNLKRPIPSNLGELKYLEYLDFSFNQLNGSIPSSLSKCPLKTLVLCSNELSGIIPSQLFERSNCSLIFLELWNNSFTGIFPSSIKKCPIQSLLIQNNNFEGQPPSNFSTKYSLVMNLANNRFSGSFPSLIADHPLLSSIDVSFNSLTGPLPSFQSAHLSLIFLNDNLFSGGVPETLTKSQNISLVYLSNNPLGGRIPLLISRLTTLKELKLSNCSLEGEIPDLSNLTSLQTLDLSHNLLNGTIPPSVFQCSNLTLLDFSYNSLSGQIPNTYSNSLRPLFSMDLSHNSLTGPIPFTQLSQSFPGLTIVKLNSNSFSGELPAFLNLYKLIILELQENQLRGELPVNINSLRSLTSLKLDNNGFNGSIPPYLFQDLNSLQYLGLSENEFEGNLPSLFGDSIQSLHFQYNRYSGSIPASFGSLSLLVDLNLSFNQLGGKIPSSLGNLKLIRQLDVSENYLAGNIPSSLTNLTHLVKFNVSYNNLSGIIPDSLTRTFNASSFFPNAALCGIVFNGTCPDPFSFLSSKSTSSLSHRIKFPAIMLVIIRYITALFALFLFLFHLISICVEHRFSYRRVIYFDPKLKPVKLLDLVLATDNFSENHSLGNGNLGQSYLAQQLPEIGTIVIKKLRPSIFNERDGFIPASIGSLGKINHTNLANIMGCYHTDRFGLELLLVYKKAVNGSLETLFDPELPAQSPLCTWETRKKISVGIVRGLEYLHNRLKPRVIHGNLKPSNVLLDQHYEPLIMDFGYMGALSLPGYTSPECLRTPTPNEMSDVYSVGILLLQLVTGKNLDDMGLEDNGGVRGWIKNRRLEQVKDPRLQNLNNDEMDKMINLGLWCTLDDPRSRPCIRQLLLKLENFDCVNVMDNDEGGEEQ